MQDNSHLSAHSSFHVDRPAPPRRHKRVSARTKCERCGKEVTITRIAQHHAACIYEGREQCPECEQWFTQDGLRHHAANCLGPFRVMQGHDHCACGRTKAKYGRCCWACEVRDEAIFDRLDRQTGTGKYRLAAKEIEAKIREALSESPNADTMYVALDERGRIIVEAQAQQ